MRLPVNDAGQRPVSYETVRRIRENGHSNIGEDTARTLATMLEVDADQIFAAAGQRKPLGRFDLPRRADRLTESERAAVVGVVDAILEASGQLRDEVADRRAAKRASMQQIAKKSARRDPDPE